MGVPPWTNPILPWYQWIPRSTERPLHHWGGPFTTAVGTSMRPLTARCNIQRNTSKDENEDLRSAVVLGLAMECFISGSKLTSGSKFKDAIGSYCFLRYTSSVLKILNEDFLTGSKCKDWYRIQAKNLPRFIFTYHRHCCCSGCSGKVPLIIQIYNKNSNHIFVHYENQSNKMMTQEETGLWQLC